MQRAVFQQITPIQFQSQATRVLPGHGTGAHDCRDAGGRATPGAVAEDQAVNDDDYHAETAPIKVIFAVLGNVVGGALLLACMFVLPQIVAGFLR